MPSNHMCFGGDESSASCKAAKPRVQPDHGFAFPSLDDSVCVNTSAFPDLQQEMNKMHSIGTMQYGAYHQACSGLDLSLRGRSDIETSGLHTHPPRNPSSPLNSSATVSMQQFEQSNLSSLRPTTASIEKTPSSSVSYLRNYSNRSDILLLAAINTFLDPAPAKYPSLLTVHSNTHMSSFGADDRQIAANRPQHIAPDVAAIVATALSERPHLASAPAGQGPRGRQISMPPPPPRLPSSAARPRSGISGIRRQAMEPLSLGPGDPDRALPRRRL